MKPDWHDRPTEPGLWVRQIKNDDYVSAHDISDMVAAADCKWLPGSRFYGPLQPDTKEEK